MHGPLNIHLPSLPLPNVARTFVEHLTNSTQPVDRQTSIPTNPDAADEQRPIQQYQSSTSVTPTHGRAHSTPAALNSSDGSSSNDSGSSFVINMEDDLSHNQSNNVRFL